ncbi:hypothetical protein PTSG_12070 [Salpingoeca rosetta]|uniref:tRNA/rRNA methyltransferase SpoU type domain-containing protein n=1 Tax=Salpingoeca rosetta (strain ATCC 50818 / BSB-021) TaxID=946362 RepID=F2U6G3_SALR5|nr:uncharacterized protein PTSG_12070 [Salpingoeca rosetta]EGD83104.1 hypothetical protein PTSG_12070 [Salpingoeca rosetta]|eukprot:XP_004995468.1 hypothetical protein PTSG_12070 [Salpingoeca rosetta]
MWAEAVAQLRPLVTPERFSRAIAVARGRVQGLACVIEGLHDTGNISAIQRTCDAFGVHDFHTIRRFPMDRMKQHRHVSKGADKWLRVHRWGSTGDCMAHLRQHGYRIAVTAVADDSSSNHASVTDLHALELDQPTAFVFGNEVAGISTQALEEADVLVQIPLVGFVSALNVSVAAGCVLHHATLQRRRFQGDDGGVISEDEALARMTTELLLRSLGEKDAADAVNDAIHDAASTRSPQQHHQQQQQEEEEEEEYERPSPSPLTSSSSSSLLPFDLATLPPTTPTRPFDRRNPATMFGGGGKYSSMKLKMNLKLAITRLQLLEKKHDNASVLARKEVATLLDNNRVELAKIKVEQIIRDDYYREALEILETYCSLALARFGLIESVQYCDPGIRKAVCTIIWATPRVSVDVVEFKELSKQFSLRYGKEFAEAARTNSTKEVCPRVNQKLSFVVPDTNLVIGYLEAIAAKYNVDWKPSPSDFDTFPDTGPSNGGGGGGMQQQQQQQQQGTPPVDLMSADLDSLNLNFPAPYGAPSPDEKPRPQQQQQQQPQQPPPQASYAFPPPLSATPQPSYPPAQPAQDSSSLAFPPPPQQSYPPTTASHAPQQQQQPPQQQQQQQPYRPGQSLLDLPDVPDAQPPSYGQASAPPNGDASFDPFVDAFPSVPDSNNNNSNNNNSGGNGGLGELHLPDPPSTNNSGRSADVPLDYDSLTRRFNALQKK